jgi:hypothetical protein
MSHLLLQIIQMFFHYKHQTVKLHKEKRLFIETVTQNTLIRWLKKTLTNKSESE